MIAMHVSWLSCAGAGSISCSGFGRVPNEIVEADELP
jgi:hypothetical protein